jgi:hypothetical protein
MRWRDCGDRRPPAFGLMAPHLLQVSRHVWHGSRSIRWPRVLRRANPLAIIPGLRAPNGTGVLTMVVGRGVTTESPPIWVVF